MKRFLILAALLLSLFPMGSDAPGKKKSPEFKGIDPKLQPYVDHFNDLAKAKGVKFKRKVSMGIKHIPNERIIGICWSFFRKREIEIDMSFWMMASEESKMALMLHELAHCFCERGHDYGEDRPYPIIDLSELSPPVCKANNDDVKPGFYADGCPTSLMHPTIVDDACYKTYKKEYESELFDRCEPW